MKVSSEAYHFTVRISEPRNTDPLNNDLVNRVYKAVARERPKSSSDDARLIDGLTPLHAFFLRHLQSQFGGQTEVRPILFDYSESYGSLIATFSVLLLGVITNYEDYRRNINAFATDVERAFDPKFSVSVSFGVDPRDNRDTRSGDRLQAASLLQKPATKGIAYVLVFVLSLMGIFDDEILGRHAAEKDMPVPAVVQELVLEKKIRDQILLGQLHDHIHGPELHHDTIYIDTHGWKKR